MLAKQHGRRDYVSKVAEGVMDGIMQIYEAHEEHYHANLDRDLQFLHPAFGACQFGVMFLTVLSIEASEHFSPRFMLWYGKTPLKIATRRLLYQGTLQYLAATLDSVCHLVVLGYDNQARILLRSLIEVGELFLASLLDLEIFEFLTESYSNHNTPIQEWRRVASASKVRNTLKDAFPKDPSGVIADYYVRYSTDTYELLSEASHGRLMALIHSFLHSDLDSDELSSSHFAKRTKGGKKTLELASQFLFFFELMFPHCIEKKHRGVYRDPKRELKYQGLLAASIFGKGAFSRTGENNA